MQRLIPRLAGLSQRLRNSRPILPNTTRYVSVQTTGEIQDGQDRRRKQRFVVVMGGAACVVVGGGGGGGLLSEGESDWGNDGDTAAVTNGRVIVIVAGGARPSVGLSEGYSDW